ncbi:MAG: WecB/TagA/CpsF family glycosyltransferase [Verrucomicrobiota bacterium]
MHVTEHEAGADVLFGSSGSALVAGERAATVTTHTPFPIAMLGVPFDSLTVSGAIGIIQRMVESRKPHQIVTANVDFLVQAMHDIELHRILVESHLVLCDGTPLVWASRFLGNRLPERVAGADLVPLLVRLAAEKQYRLFFLGGAPEVTAQAVANLRDQYPRLHIVGCYSPPFAELLDMDHDEIRRQVLQAQPDLLFVSFGCPKAEKWIAMHYRSLGVPVTIGVGATIDFLAGRVKRAPVCIQKSGTEWIFRLLQEPRRLGPRYFDDLRHFGRAIVAQWWRMHGGSSKRLPARCSVVKDNPSWHCIEVKVRLDAATVRSHAALWERATRKHCLLDLAAVEFIDSTGLGLLLRLERSLRAAGRRLILLAPGPSVRRALQSVRLQDFFLHADNLDDACQFLHAWDAEAPVSVNGAVDSFAWRGDITAANSDEVWRLTEAQLESMRPADGYLRIDLAQVRFIDSAGARLMLRARQHAQRRGLCLRFKSAPTAVRNVLQHARLEDILLGGVL